MVIGFTPSAPRALWVRAVCCAMLLASTLTTTLAAAAAQPIAPLTAYANTTQIFVVNGAFGGSESLAFEASQYDGKALPSWMRLDSNTGEFTLRPPSSEVGKVYRITVRATNDTDASFYLLVDNDSDDCTVEANVDHRGMLLSCGSNKVQLHGKSSTGRFRWTGPGGFKSSASDPWVNEPGLYQLDADGGGSCSRLSIVEVMNKNYGCSEKSAKNEIPVGRISTDRSSGTAPLRVRFDGSGSSDADGKVIAYSWYWDGGDASGSNPYITFPEGKHEVILVVTDDTGARSTDRITITAGKAAPKLDAVSYWLEAECADYGSRWNRTNSGSAAGGAYVVSQSSALSSAPSDDAAHQVRFTVDVAKAGEYYLFARVDAANESNDSYWVRINGSPWIKWFSGFATGRGFQWNAVPNALPLRAGSNRIDFAYREPNTKLDKIVLSNSDEVPDGQGGSDPTCGTSPTPVAGDSQQDFWLEAECASVGRRWSTQSSSAASSGTYVVVRSGNAINSAPSDIPDNRVRFSLSSVRGGSYKFFARIDAPTNIDDSFWVRINGGSWYKWASGIEQRRGFQWNKLPRSVELANGTNIIDVAFREDGTKLDKLFLTRGSTTPKGMGGKASNCGDAPMDDMPTDNGGVTNIWMEAECGRVGSAWTKSTSNTTSLYVDEANSTSGPSSSSSERIDMSVSVVKSGTYHLFFRMEAASLATNSFWVRVDDGQWMKFWKEVGGADLLTQDTQWRKVGDDGKDMTFQLSPGKHMITISLREAGTRLDRVLLSTSATVPTGVGGSATNCGTGTSVEMMGMATTPAEELDPVEEITTELNLYPNPASFDLTVELSSTYTGGIDVFISDATGRRVRQLHFDKGGDQFRTRIDVSDLPNGMYHLRTLEGDRQTMKPFVKQ